MSTPTGSPRVQRKGQKLIQTLEVKSYAEEKSYVIILSGHVNCLMEALKLLPLRKDVDYGSHLQAARVSYMPDQPVDKMGSSIRMFANDYARVKHVTKRSTSEEVEVFAREQVSDTLVNAGWELVGFSSHEGYTKTGMAVVERWLKKNYSL